MSRALLIAGLLAALAASAQAQEAARAPAPAADARAAGLRYLTWPGRPPIQPTRAAPPAAVTPAAAAPSAPVLPAAEPAPPPASAVQAAAPARPALGVRYYSLHRQAGRAPDPLPEAQTLAREEITVTLAAPENPSLAERDRRAAGQEQLDLLRDLPPDRLARLLEEQL